MIHYLQKCDKYVEMSTIPRKSFKLYCFYYEFQHTPPKEALVRPWTCEGYTEHFNFHKKSLFGDRFGPQRAFGYAWARV